MTTDQRLAVDHGAGAAVPNAAEAPPADELLPDEALQWLDQVAQHRAKASRGQLRSRARRRMLAPALVAAAVLGTAALADKFVQGSLPVPVGSAAPTTAPASAPAGSTGSAAALQASVKADTKALSGVARALAADKQAIAALARSQAQLAATAASGGEGGDAGAAPATVSLPSLPSVPSVQLPSVAVPNVAVPATPAPAVHATTGASVVLP